MYNLDYSISLAKAYLGESFFEGLDISYEKVNEASLLTISKKNHKVEIKYGVLASLFYALSLIKQNHKKDNYEINLHRHFKTNAVMHDCSRNGPVNITQAKEMIMVAALFGLNRFMLYTEDVYEIEGEPWFGYLRGRYTKKELKDLVAYSKSFGVQLIPSIQTLSHLNEALKWPHYADIADTINTLLVDEPKTYQLIEKMISTCEEVFETDTIHINMDEAVDIASGSFIWKDKILNKKELFLRHLNKVVKICKNHHFKPIMWGDMFFKLEADNSNGHVNWYTFKGKLSEQVISLIPDVGIVYWDYYNGDYETYDRMFKACKETGKEVFFCDGAVSWTGFAPNIKQSFEITRFGLDSAIKHNIENIMMSSWGDGGNECSVVGIYPAMALHSCYEFYGKGKDREVSKILETVTGDPLKRWTLLQEINHVRKEQTAYENLSKPFFYQDILLGVADGKVKEEYSLHFEKVMKLLKSASKKSKKYGYVYNSLSLLSDFLINKATIGLRLRKTYKEGKKELFIPFLSELKLLEKKLKKFLEAYRYQWYKENKPFGFEIIDGRIGFLTNRIKTAYLTISDYIEGKIDTIQEFEEDILPWHETDVDEPTLIGYWREVCSPNIIY